jgi:hypothetical protein
VVIGIVTLALLVFLVSTVTRGGRAFFSPYSLDYKGQWEITVLGGSVPIYRSSLADSPNALVTMLRDERFATPMGADNHPWELVYHANEAWKDGDGRLYDILVRYRSQLIEWSKADHERARVYWEEGFRLLRSDNKAEVRCGIEVLKSCWGYESVSDLQQAIAATKAMYIRNRPPP